jgi:hypothetical protein
VAERNEKVLKRIREELSVNPQTGSKALYQIAQNVDRATREDTLQQFHARYVLPIKREQGGGGRKAGNRRRGASPQPAKRGRKAKKEASPEEQQASAPVRRQRRSRSAEQGRDRDSIRATLLQFATDFSGAETRPEIVHVLSRIDEYVDQIVSKR